MREIAAYLSSPAAAGEGAHEVGEGEAPVENYQPHQKLMGGCQRRDFALQLPPPPLRGPPPPRAGEETASAP